MTCEELVEMTKSFIRWTRVIFVIWTRVILIMWTTTKKMGLTQYIKKKPHHITSTSPSLWCHLTKLQPLISTLNPLREIHHQFYFLFIQLLFHIHSHTLWKFGQRFNGVSKTLSRPCLFVHVIQFNTRVIKDRFDVL